MRNILIVISALIIYQISLGQNVNTNVLSELNVESTEFGSTVTARVFNKTDFYYNLKYVFTVTKFDKNYKSLSKSLEEFLNSEDASDMTLDDFLKSQDARKYSSKDSYEDFFTLEPYQSRDLYRFQMEPDVSNQTIVLLLIYNDEDKIISRNRVVFDEKVTPEFLEKEEKVSTNKFELTGLVAEETLTKNGKDFHDRFYYYYSNNKINGDEIVIIEEMFTFRTRTKIIVKIGEQEIISFFGSSNDEYIEEMAKISVQKVYQYFENKKKEKSYLTRY